MQKNIRSKKDLEIFLQKLGISDNYRNDLEQYPTDASNAAEILFLAYLDGNIEGKSVADLGAGNGILGVGAALMGASPVYALEIDPAQAEAIRENSRDLNVEIQNMDVSAFTTRVDTVVMNPPFGSVKARADRVFLEKAVELSDNIYSIHNVKSADYVRTFYARNADITREEVIRIRTPRIYSHHKKDFEYIRGVFFSCRVKH